MQNDIHPKYEETTFSCSCGNKIVVKSASGRREAHLEICNKCHPFYTGQQKMVDTGGRIDRFQKRYGKKSIKKAS